MKKKSKIILFAAIGTILLGTVGGIIGVSVNKASEGGVSGTIHKINDLIVEGTGTYDWKRHEVDIPINTTTPGEIHYASNCEGDFISAIGWYIIDYDGLNSKDVICISYYDWFYWLDDFQAIFVFTDGYSTYTTDISYSHIAGDDSFDFVCTKLDPSYDNRAHNYTIIEQWKIIEVWVRTED